MRRLCGQMHDAVDDWTDPERFAGPRVNDFEPEGADARLSVRSEFDSQQAGDTMYGSEPVAMITMVGKPVDRGPGTMS